MFLSATNQLGLLDTRAATNLRTVCCLSTRPATSSRWSNPSKPFIILHLVNEYLRHPFAVRQEALDDTHAFATHALRVGPIGCSRQIYSLNDSDLATIEIRTAEDEFPAEDLFTVGEYWDLKEHIAAAHVAIGRTNKKPVDAKFACDVKDALTSIVDKLAVWADPRFDYETDLHPYEQAANRDLIVWRLQVFKEISQYILPRRLKSSVDAKILLWVFVAAHDQARESSRLK